MVALDIVSIHEIAERLEVSRIEAEAVVESPDFPEPLARLGIGPVWSWETIEADIRA